MAQDPGPKNHHYIPRFLLERFTFGKKKRVWVYDKSSDKQFEANIKNIASETRFYEIRGNDLFKVLGDKKEQVFKNPPPELKDIIEKGDFKITMENALSDVEGKAQTVIGKIIASGTLQGLTEYDTIVLAHFIAVQMVRTKTHIDKVKDTTEMIREKLLAMGASEEEVNKTIGSMGDEQGIKYFHMNQIKGAKEFVPILLSKKWVLYKATQGQTFYISDNPVVLQNQKQRGFRGNLGLAVDGIEIYMPLAKNYALALFCPSIGEMFEDAAAKLRLLPHFEPPLGRKYIADMLESMITGRSVDSPRECIINFNYLQTMFASRFVYSHDGDFALVKQMIGDDEKYRGPLKPVVN